MHHPWGEIMKRILTAAPGFLPSAYCLLPSAFQWGEGGPPCGRRRRVRGPFRSGGVILPSRSKLRASPEIA
jgi:hypothetical protein